MVYNYTSMLKFKHFLENFFQKPELVFVTLSFIFGVTSAFLMPQLLVNDEGAHLQRSYAIATGQWANKRCYFPEALIQASYKGDNIENLKEGKSSDNSHSNEHYCGSASPYSPIMHLPQAVGVFIALAFNGSIETIVLFGRLANVVFYSLVLSLIIKHVRIGKWVFTVVGLLPILVHLSGSLSSDVMNNIAVFGFIATMFNAFMAKTTLSRKHLLILFLFSILLPITKLPNIILLFPLLFLPAKAFPKNPVRFSYLPFNIYKYLYGASLLLGGLICVFAWQKIYGSPLIIAAPENPLETRPWHFLRIVYNTYFNESIGYNDVLFRGITGIFSFKFSFSTVFNVLTWLTLLLALLVSSKEESTLSNKAKRVLTLSSFTTVVTFVLAVTYALYTAWAIQPYRLGPNAPYADGVQGRYFSALLVLATPLFISLRKYITLSAKDFIIGSIIFSSCFVQLLFYIYLAIKFSSGM